MTRTKFLMSAIRRMPIGQQLIPTEAAIGWPVPYRANKRAYVVLPVFGLAPVPSKKCWAVFAPMASVTLDWRTATVVEYVDFRFRSAWAGEDLSRPIGESPSAAARMMRREEREALSQRLCHTYDAVMETLAQGGEVPDVMLDEMGAMLRVLLEPCLWPFYKEISPRFHAQFLASA